MRLAIAITISLGLTFTVHAQQVERVMYDVFDGTDQFEYGFAGGMEAPQLSAADLDRDGTLDIYIYDRAGYTITPFVYTGSGSEVRYSIEWSVVDSFPDLSIWSLLRDFNGDGVEDIFAATSHIGVQGIDVYRGAVTDGKLTFKRMTFDLDDFDLLYVELGGSFTPMYSAWTDVPDINDVDGDGDLDILTFEPAGSFLTYYKNESLERGLGIDTFLFKWEDKCWGKFRENDISEEVFLSDDPGECADGTGIPIEPRHSGSAEVTFDYDNDGDMDLLLGDLASPGIVYLQNGGSKDAAWMTSQETEFPSTSTSVRLEYFVTPAIIDVDHDGQMDFLASSNTDNFSENVDVLWYYRNRGELGDPDFRLEQRNLFVDEMLDFGTSARPTIMDVDNDGLRDIIVGTGGYYKDGLRDPRLVYLRNIGTAMEPVFTVEDDDFLGFSAFGSAYQWDFAPEAGDLDGDGDTDLIIGEFDGGLFFVENTAGPGATPQWANPVYPFMDIYVGAASTPCIADINGDGLNDLVIGERLGNSDNDGKCSNLGYFQNVGEKGAPQFISDVNAAPNEPCYGRILFNGQIALPEFSAPDLLRTPDGLVFAVGSQDGEIALYNGVEGNIGGAFDLINDHLGGIKDGFRTAPEFEDIDGDGLYEIIIGNFRGGLTAYQTDIAKDATSSSQIADNDHTLVVYPNPLSDFAFVSGVTAQRIMVYDMQGRVVDVPVDDRTMDFSTVVPGMYLVQVWTADGVYTDRVVVSR